MKLKTKNCTQTKAVKWSNVQQSIILHNFIYLFAHTQCIFFNDDDADVTYVILNQIAS